MEVKLEALNIISRNAYLTAANLSEIASGTKDSEKAGTIYFVMISITGKIFGHNAMPEYKTSSVSKNPIPCIIINHFKSLLRCFETAMAKPEIKKKRPPVILYSVRYSPFFIINRPTP